MKKLNIGDKINYLTIQEITVVNKHSRALCLCECGLSKWFFLSNITPSTNKRYTQSCGCKRTAIVSKKNTVHGLSDTKFYKRWRSMWDRVSPKYICAKSYTHVSVCDEWKDFNNFYNDMYTSYLAHRDIYGERDTTLDRTNVYGNYTPTNCRWATRKEQANNKKRSYQQV